MGRVRRGLLLVGAVVLVVGDMMVVVNGGMVEGGKWERGCGRRVRWHVEVKETGRCRVPRRPHMPADESSGMSRGCFVL